MLAAVLAGSGVGLGALAVLHGFLPRRRPLAAALSRLDQGGQGGQGGTLLPAPWGLSPSGAAPLARSLVEGLGIDLGRLRHDLRVAGRLPERHALDKVTATLSFFVLAPASAAVLSVAGVHVGNGMVLIGATVLTAIGFVIPDLLLRSEARRRRQEFRHALSAYLDLVSIVVAGGGGTETALYAAVDVGTDWPFAELRRTLATCRLSGEPPWAALERLGAELEVDELREIAAGVGLAGTYGAKVRQSLAARSTSLRDHRLAEIETEAQAATEKMSVPVVLMLFGFIAFVLYPALQFVLEGL